MQIDILTVQRKIFHSELNRENPNKNGTDSSYFVGQVGEVRF